MNITGANEFKNKSKEISTGQRLQNSCESKISDSSARDQLVAYDSLTRENSPRIFQNEPDSLQLSRVSMVHEVGEDRNNIDEAYCCENKPISNLDADAMLVEPSRENRFRNHVSPGSLSSNISEKKSSNNYHKPGNKKSGTVLDNDYFKVSPCAKSVSEPKDSNQIQELSDPKGNLERGSSLNDSNSHRTRTSRVLSLSEKKRILNLKDHIELIDLTRQHQSGQQGQLRRASPPLKAPVPLNLTPYHAKKYPKKYHEVQVNRRKIQRSTEYKSDTSNVVTPKISENPEFSKDSVANDSIDDSLSELFMTISTHSLPQMKPINESYPGPLDIALKKVEDEDRFIYSRCQNSPVFKKEFLNFDLKFYETEEEIILDHSERSINKYSEEALRAAAVENPYLVSTNASDLDNDLKNDPLQSFKINSDEDFSTIYGSPTKSKDPPVENFQIPRSRADRSGDTTDRFFIEKYINQGPSHTIVNSETESPEGNQKMTQIDSRNCTAHPINVDTDDYSSPLTRCSKSEEEPSYAHIEYADECTSDDDFEYIESRGTPNQYRSNQTHDINGTETTNANQENENISDLLSREKYSYVTKGDSESIYSNLTVNPNLDEGYLSTHIQPIGSNSHNTNFSNSSEIFVERKNAYGNQEGVPGEGNSVEEEIPTHGQFMKSDSSPPQVYNRIQDFRRIKTQHSNQSFTNFVDRPESSSQAIQRAEINFNQMGAQASTKPVISSEDFEDLHKSNMELCEYNLQLMEVIAKATEELEWIQVQAQEVYTGIPNIPVDILTSGIPANYGHQNMYGKIPNQNREYGNPSISDLSAYPTQTPSLRLGRCDIPDNSYDQTEFHEAPSYSGSSVENYTVSDESAALTASDNSVMKDKGKGKAI